MNFSYEGLRSMYPEKYDELMDLKEIAYGSTKEHFLNYFPHSSKRENFVFEDHFILEEDKRIVTHVGLFPMEVIAGKSKVKVGGIGGVATHLNYQGKGYMGRLLKYSVEKMREREIPLSILWGDTQRYRHFGWETAGRKIVFCLDQRSIKKVKVGKKFILKGYTDKVDLDKIMEIHEKEPLKVKRTKKDYEEKLKRTQIQIWMGNKENCSCYVVLNENTVVEFGGEPSLVVELFSFLLSHYPLNTLCVHYPYTDTEMLHYLYRVSSSWQILPLGMIKVIDLKKTLLSFKSEIQENANIYGISNGDFLTLKMKDSHQKASLIKKEGEIEVKDEELEEVVSLSDIEMVRLLFGPTPEEFGKNEKQKRFLKAVFPLNFYVWWLDHI